MNPMDWYQNQETTRQKTREKQDIHLMNQQLQTVLHRIERDIDKSNYMEAIQEGERPLVQSGIWKLSYRNNMENKQVVLEQALLIQCIVNQENHPKKRYIQDEVDRVLRRLGTLDWGLYGEYNRRKHILLRKEN